MPVPVDNPAGRLHIVLTRLVDHGEGQSLDQAWARTLDCKDGDFRSISERLAEVTSLLNDCRIAAYSLRASTDVDDLLWHFPSWSRAIFGFQQNRSVGVQPRKIIGPDALAGLGTFATVLHLNAPEIVFRSDIESNQISDCRRQLDELIMSVEQELLIPEQVRLSILRNLVEVAESFDFLEYRGAEHLARSANSAAQFLTLKEESRGFSTAPVLERLDRLAEKATNIFDKVWSMLAPPAGAIYILATGDVMSGGMIMATNPRVAQSMGTIATAIRAGTAQRHVEPSDKPT